MIDYEYIDELLDEGATRDILITDGIVTISGKRYTVSDQTVIIDNSILSAESLQISQSLCSQDQLAYGSCEAAELAFDMYDNIPTLRGKTVKVYIFPDHDASKMLQLGVYKVYSDELTSDRTKRTITAYDAMYDIINSDVADWYNTLLPNVQSLTTLAAFRTSFLNHFGIAAEGIVLANDSLTVKRTIEPETLSGADVIRAICEINGCFGTITNEGKFRFVELSPDIDAGLFPSDELYPADDLYPQDINHDVTYVRKNNYISVQFEDYLSEAITRLTIRTDDEDVGVTVGTPGNDYIITGNFLVYGKNATELTQIAQRAFEKIENRYYQPCTVDAAGNPLHEVGDPIRISTTYRGITTYILERTLKGIQALRDTYTAQGEQYNSEQLNSVASQFKQLSGKTLKIKADVDGLGVDLEDLDTRESSHYSQTSAQIALKVSKGNVVNELDYEFSEISVTSNRIMFESTGSLVINTADLKLDASGNATFSGNITAAAITGSTITGSTITGGTITGGTITGTGIKSEGTHGALEISDGFITVHPVNSSFPYIQMSGISPGLAITDSSNNFMSMNATEINAKTFSISSQNTLRLAGSSGIIAINSPSSSYDIALNGSVDVGYGYTHTIRIKGHIVDYIDVEDVNGNIVHVLGYT